MAISRLTRGVGAALLGLLVIGQAPRSTARPKAAGELQPVAMRYRAWLEWKSRFGETESIDGRVLDYLERHGDRGRIDPERRRQLTAEEYEKHRARQAALERRSASERVAQWISLGPTNGAGRMTAIAPVQGAPGAAYAGAAGGGVWKTTDGGSTWTPLTEGLHDLSVGALAVAPSNPNLVYLGTGEGGASSSFIPGIGFLKSMDGGATWILPDSVLATQFYRISVHPTDPNEIVAATNRGAFRSTDGGSTWTNVVPHADYGDVADMVRDPTDPRVLYATTWCVGGDCTFRSARVLRSADGGATWSDRSSGLPTSQFGRFERTSIAIAPSNPQILYAARTVRDLVVTGESIAHIYKTTDAGVTWTDLPAVFGDPLVSRYMGSQSHYDNVLVVSPADPNVVLAGGVVYIRSTDGGATFTETFEADDVHVDAHDLQYQGSTLWIANDGGIWTSEDHGATATGHNEGLVTFQLYSVANDPSHRARIIAGSQDNGTVQRVDPGTVWRTVGGGDGLQCVVHPVLPEMAWITAQGGTIRRTRAAGSNTRPAFEAVTPPFDDEEMVPFRTIARLDPREPNVLYSASTRLWRSEDGGDTWRPLPTATTDMSEWSERATIRAVAFPGRDSPLLIVAKGNGVFRSADGGRTWTSGRGLPENVVTNVEIDPRDASVAFATIATTTGPSLYRSGDGGQTWTASATGLPPFAAQVVRFDPLDSNDVYCGTDVGLYRSTDRGGTWARLGAGLPASSIHDVQILEDGSLLRVATYGRGVWELELPRAANTAPFARITAPGGAVTVAANVPVELSGEVGDRDAGDAAEGTWFFTDDGTSAALPAGGASVRHVFRRGGSFPVALGARDRRGARSSAIVTVSVREPADDCATPVVIPGAGPFPYAVAWNNAAGTTETTDPDPPCLPGRGRVGSTWLEFTPAASGSYVFSTCTDVNTALTVLTGAACGPYTPLTLPCPRIGGFGGCGQGATTVTAPVQAGQTLRLLLGGVVAANVGPVRLVVAPSGISDEAPRVERVGAAFGPASGGTNVVIVGTGFAGGASVSFGGVAGTEVAVLGTRVISARTPPHPAGLVEVAVTVPGAGTGVLGNAFRYEPVASAGRVPPVPAPTRPPARVITPR